MRRPSIADGGDANEESGGAKNDPSTNQGGNHANSKKKIPCEPVREVKNQQRALLILLDTIGGTQDRWSFHPRLREVLNIPPRRTDLDMTKAVLEFATRHKKELKAFTKEWSQLRVLLRGAKHWVASRSTAFGKHVEAPSAATTLSENETKGSMAAAPKPPNNMTLKKYAASSKSVAPPKFTGRTHSPESSGADGLLQAWNDDGNPESAADPVWPASQFSQWLVEDSARKSSQFSKDNPDPTSWKMNEVTSPTFFKSDELVLPVDHQHKVRPHTGCSPGVQTTLWWGAGNEEEQSPILQPQRPHSSRESRNTGSLQHRLIASSSPILQENLQVISDNAPTSGVPLSTGSPTARQHKGLAGVGTPRSKSGVCIVSKSEKRRKLTKPKKVGTQITKKHSGLTRRSGGRKNIPPVVQIDMVVRGTTDHLQSALASSAITIIENTEGDAQVQARKQIATQPIEDALVVKGLATSASKKREQVNCANNPGKIDYAGFEMEDTNEAGSLRRYKNKAKKKGGVATCAVKSREVPLKKLKDAGNLEAFIESRTKNEQLGRFSVKRQRIRGITGPKPPGRRDLQARLEAQLFQLAM
jgi:hypothetical protein